MMRVLVCGGRDYADSVMVANVLCKLHNEACIDLIIEGGAMGADRLASLWAQSYNVASERYPADWQTHGKAAGHIRNGQMLEEGRPDVVIAFPGGRGTADMVRKARKAGVEVVEIAP